MTNKLNLEHMYLYKLTDFRIKIEGHILAKPGLDTGWIFLKNELISRNDDIELNDIKFYVANELRKIAIND